MAAVIIASSSPVLMSTHRPLMTETPGSKLDRGAISHTPTLSMNSISVCPVASTPAGSNGLLDVSSLKMSTYCGLCHPSCSWFPVALRPSRLHRRPCRWTPLGLCRQLAAGPDSNRCVASCLAGQMIVSLSPSLPRREVGLVISPIVSEPHCPCRVFSLSHLKQHGSNKLFWDNLLSNWPRLVKRLDTSLHLMWLLLLLLSLWALADRFACASGLESLGSYQQSHSVGSPVKRPPQHQHPWNWTPLVS